jgi:hypothetical protein
MSTLIPKAKGQKISYADLIDFPEKVEMIDGNLLFSEREKKAVLLAYTTNFGLEFFVSLLPKESLKELKGLLEKVEID